MRLCAGFVALSQATSQAGWDLEWFKLFKKFQSPKWIIETSKLFQMYPNVSSLDVAPVGLWDPFFSAIAMCCVWFHSASVSDPSRRYCPQASVAFWTLHLGRCPPLAPVFNGCFPVFPGGFQWKMVIGVVM